MTIEEALQIHLEEMDFTDIEKNADYHSRLIVNILRPYFSDDYNELVILTSDLRHEHFELRKGELRFEDKLKTINEDLDDWYKKSLEDRVLLNTLLTMTKKMQYELRYYYGADKKYNRYKMINEFQIFCNEIDEEVIA